MYHDQDIFLGSGLQPVWDIIETVSPFDSTVLICGESGTGKELVAEAIHRKSKRKDKPFVKRNCAALAEGVLESELFGHERGAFTGADKRTLGIFELAHLGSIFLDEICELSPKTQAKLLRVIQDQVFQRVGGAENIRVDVRIIAATNKDLDKEIKEGRFRDDLFWRLNVVKISIPPLRDRRQDIPGFVDHFLRIFNVKYNRCAVVEDELLVRLMAYGWPGNVRQLKNAIEKAVILSKYGVLTENDLGLLNTEIGSQQSNVIDMIREREKGELEAALIQTAGNISRSARLLEMSRSSFRYRAKKFSLI